MKEFLLVLFIIVIICYSVKDVEGFLDYNECNPRNIIIDEECNEKWGLPACTSWKITPDIEKIKNSNIRETLPSYQTNHYLYEVGYGDENGEPKPINSTYFS
tara:strand:- start:101 stop:406 length:306 start_codon:yes stop_codon:yes gene_type:complete